MSHDQSIPHPELSCDASQGVTPSPEAAVEVDTAANLMGRRPGSPRRGRQTVLAEQVGGQPQLTPQQRLLVLDTWMKSGLPAGDYAPLVGVSKHTLYGWKARFEQEGPAGLMDQPRGGPTGSRLSEVTKRAVLMMKAQHPEWGVDRIATLLARGPGLSASPNAVLRVLLEAGCQVEDRPTAPHTDKVRFFERATANQLWQTDLFTFVLKRQNQRVYLVAFLDDHSRYIVSYGLHASQSAALVLEVFRAGIASYGTPQEVLTDNGTQYVTWRGKSQFSHECDKRGIKHIVATPRHPETLGKTERFWGTLWRECLETALFADLGEARLRLGHFIDHYNFQRPHSGIGGSVPADRFFGAAPAVRAAVQERVAANALELAKNGVPKEPFYLTGNVAGQAFSVHAEGEQVILQRGGQRASIALDPRPEPVVPPPSVAPVAAVVSTAAPLPLPMPVPVAPAGVVVSPWTGAHEQPAAGSALDRLHWLLTPVPLAAPATVAAPPGAAS